MVQKGDLSSDYGTPMDLFDAVRSEFGCAPALDLASSETHNDRIRATNYYSAENPCPDKPVCVGWVWCNPPAGMKVVADFWEKWLYATAWCEHGAFLVYQIDHWRSLRPVPLWFHLMKKRQRYIGAPCQAHFSGVLLATREIESPLFSVTGRIEP